MKRIHPHLHGPFTTQQNSTFKVLLLSAPCILFITLSALTNFVHFSCYYTSPALERVSAVLTPHLEAAQTALY
jgi:hypothetical protein